MKKITIKKKVTIMKKKNEKNEQVKEVRLKDYVKEVHGHMQVINEEAFLIDVRRMLGF